jgi:PAS domain S-box-containing protein
MEYALRQTLEAAPVGIAQFDSAGRFLLVNRRLCDIFDYPEQEVLGKTFQELTFPEDLEGCLRRNAELAAGLIPHYRHEKRFVRRDGSIAWVCVTVSAVRDAQGAVQFFVGIAEDVTQERHERAQRAALEDRLAAALAASATGTFRWDITTNALWWDPNVYRLMGVPQGDGNIGLEESMTNIHAADRDAVAAAVQRCGTVGGRFCQEFRVVWPDGSQHCLRCVGETRRDEQGRLSHMTGALTDITDLWQVQGELKNVVAVVAHDLRNPLQSLVMGAGVLAQPDVAEEKRASILRIMNRTLSGMDRLLTDLLDASRIEAGTFAVDHKPVDVAALMGELTDLFDARARQHGFRFSCEVSEALPGLSGDRGRLAQVLSNLVGNALKFARAPGEVVVAVRPDGDRLHFSVRDNGPGIPVEDQARLFDRFWQRHPGSAGGAGLGLAIAKGIVEAHSGSIWVESTPSGSTFHFTLPAALEHHKGTAHASRREELRVSSSNP